MTINESVTDENNNDNINDNYNKDTVVISRLSGIAKVILFRRKICFCKSGPESILSFTITMPYGTS